MIAGVQEPRGTLTGVPVQAMGRCLKTSKFERICAPTLFGTDPGCADGVIQRHHLSAKPLLICFIMVSYHISSTITRHARELPGLTHQSHVLSTCPRQLLKTHRASCRQKAFVDISRRTLCKSRYFIGFCMVLLIAWRIFNHTFCKRFLSLSSQCTPAIAGKQGGGGGGGWQILPWHTGMQTELADGLWTFPAFWHAIRDTGAHKATVPATRCTALEPGTERDYDCQQTDRVHLLPLCLYSQRHCLQKLALEHQVTAEVRVVPLLEKGSACSFPPLL